MNSKRALLPKGAAWEVAALNAAECGASVFVTGPSPKVDKILPVRSVAIITKSPSLPLNNYLTMSRRHSASPLLDPATCCLVLISPSENDQFHNSACTHKRCRRKITTLIAAAQLVAAPIFVCYPDTNSLSADCPLRTFSCEADGCIWRNESFLKALDAENRSALVIAGYWLDRDVRVSALYALADCYDVYIPLDASPAHSKAAARIAEARLFQAGAIPLLTKHVLQEWMIEASTAAQRSALLSLIKQWP
jgi:hypothetical protein